MCGLVGVAGDLSSTNRKKVFEDLLTVDVVRGPHSTGVAMVPRWLNDGLELCKSIGPPPVLFSMDEYQKMMKKTAKIYIGHNRYATKGKITDENAHPFAFPKIMGAHNGTLDYQTHHMLYNYDKFGTDSESLFSHMNQYGFQSTMDILNRHSGDNAWALSWYDASDDTINLTRNSKRPLFYVYSEDMNNLFWASELDMLKWVLKRNHVKIHEEKSYVVTEDCHYKWKIPKSIVDKFENPTVHVIEKPEVPKWESMFPVRDHRASTAMSYVGGSGYNHSNTSTNVGTSSKRSANVIDFLNKKKMARLTLNTKKWRPPYKDHNGMVIGRNKVEERIKNGCTFCPHPKAVDFEKNFKWGQFIFFCRPDTDGRPVLLCEDCYNNEDIKNLCKELL